VLAIASDHAGFDGKELIKQVLDEEKVKYTDYGPSTPDKVDYPDFGEKVASAVSMNMAVRGILVCGSGLGMSIVANKFPGIRATLVYDKYTAEMSRLHNDSNILVVGGRSTKPEAMREIVKIWLHTGFEARHQMRIDKIAAIEKKTMR